MSEDRTKSTVSKNSRSHGGPESSSWVDSVLQYLQPSEWRIARPGIPIEPVESDDPAEPPQDGQASDRVIAELATCLWYLKTKYFKQSWGSEDSAGDDPRTRRALGRLTRGVDALKAGGVEIVDPTNKRYPEGGENMMRPIQFTPTAGLTFAMVNETVTPLVYRDERLIQRAEVFVATPHESSEGVDGVTVQAPGGQPSDAGESTISDPEATEEQVVDGGLEEIAGDAPDGSDSSVVTTPESEPLDRAQGEGTESKEDK